MQGYKDAKAVRRLFSSPITCVLSPPSYFSFESLNNIFWAILSLKQIKS